MAGILNVCSCIYNQSPKAPANFRKTAVGYNICFLAPSITSFAKYSHTNKITQARDTIQILTIIAIQ